MMTIELSNIGKRYRSNWIFKGASLQFGAPDHYALLGSNGSGKSTLLRLISGLLLPTKGTISWTYNGQKITADNIYKLLSYTAPSMNLVDEMNLNEFLNFHYKFKKLHFFSSISEIIDFLDLSHAKHTYLKDFSSGMYQRVKLAQAFFTETPLLLLDEPCSNLDKAGIKLYQDLLKNYTKGRLVIVASNDPVEYPDINNQIFLHDLKSARI